MKISENIESVLRNLWKEHILGGRYIPQLHQELERVRFVSFLLAIDLLTELRLISAFADAQCVREL
jgi:hypothetical protein